METKVCRICKQEKPLSDFRKRVSKLGVEGKDSKCAICDNKYIVDCKWKRKFPNGEGLKIQSLEGEIWVAVIEEGFEGRYEISNYGRLKSLPHKKCGIEVLMTACLNNHGYYYFSLSKDNKRNNFFQHRLIGQYFIPNPLNKPQILHKNDIPTDNRIDNLEWGTQKENLEQASKRNRMNHGEGRALSKLKEKDVLYIFNSKKNNADLGRMFNVSISTPFNIKHGRSWSYLTGKKYEGRKNNKRNKSAA